MSRLLTATLAFAAVFGPVSGIQAAPIYVDFGATGVTETPAPAPGGDFWNNITNFNNASASLTDAQSNATGITLQITDGFQATNPDGAQTNTITYPATATRDSFYGQTSTNSTAAFTLSGLDVNTQYELTFFASRVGVTSPATDARWTAYIVTGSGAAETVILNATNNTSNTVTTSPINPNAQGVITVNLQRGTLLVGGEVNTSANGFYYLNTLEINVPEPGSLGLMGLGTLLIAARRR